MLSAQPSRGAAHGLALGDWGVGRSRRVCLCGPEHLPGQVPRQGVILLGTCHYRREHRVGACRVAQRLPAGFHRQLVTVMSPTGIHTSEMGALEPLATRLEVNLRTVSVEKPVRPTQQVQLPHTGPLPLVVLFGVRAGGRVEECPNPRQGGGRDESAVADIPHLLGGDADECRNHRFG